MERRDKPSVTHSAQYSIISFRVFLLCVRERREKRNREIQTKKKRKKYHLLSGGKRDKREDRSGRQVSGGDSAALIHSP